MTEPTEKVLSCPNCGPGTKTHAKAGGGLVCEQCGGTFTFAAGEAKVADVGELDRVKADVQDLKQTTSQLAEKLGDRRQPPRTEEDLDELRQEIGDDPEEDDDEEDL